MPNHLPEPNRTPVPAPAETAGTAAQAAFRQAVQAVENLRDQLREQRTAQAEARRRYWQQVGPVAAAVVAARRALFAPLEEALLLGCFSRLEEEQITALILGNARTLEERFGEDEAAMMQKYTPAKRDAAAAAETTARTAETGPTPTPPPHEQAAEAARNRRKTKAQRAAEAAEATARADQQQLEANAKTVYRQLARAHHPDLSRDPEQHAARTAQMQRITAAYEADDLYTLLQLLAESGPADAAADDVLARYTRALLQQQTTLKQALNEVKYGPDGLSNLSARKQELELRQLKRDLRAEADYVQAVARQLPDPAALRELLRELAAEGLASI